VPPAAAFRDAFSVLGVPAGEDVAGGDPLPQPTAAESARHATTAAKGALRILIGRWCARRRAASSPSRAAS
jgi:hypothetical protein